MTIKIGDRIPNATLNYLKDGVQAINTDEIFKGKNVVLFSVPGAFTPTCSAKHLPGYVENLAKFTNKGIDVACLAVNDAFVMDAWGQAQGVSDQFVMAADPVGAFTKAVGMDVDVPALGGLRSKRYAMVIEEGVVTQFLPEEDGFSVLASTAECVLDTL